MHDPTEQVNAFLLSAERWSEEMTFLRDILLSCGLDEAFKWGCPCYTHNSKNVVLIHSFKNYCALSFFKGALLQDPHGLLVQPTENSNAGRQIRFNSTAQIVDQQEILKTYINDAISIEGSGRQVKKKTVSEYELPDELQVKFQHNPAFKSAFLELTPGRQKGYLLHFSKPKRSSSRTARIEKCVPRIMDGYGLTDCTCGLSKRKPNCDGSHNQLKKDNLQNSARS